jgi:hypothetical protein
MVVGIGFFLVIGSGSSSFSFTTIQSALAVIIPFAPSASNPDCRIRDDKPFYTDYKDTARLFRDFL